MTNLTEFDPELWAAASQPMAHPLTITCACGRRVTLHDPWANDCDCGACYNGAGQRLAPREYWGEETGEHFV